MRRVLVSLMGAAMAGWVGSPAGAADLGRPAPAAVDYVKVCDAYGSGFFYIPGTETCLRIGGGVRFDADYAQERFVQQANRYVTPYPYRNWNAISTLARARIDFEARTGTEYGLLRSVARIEFENGTFHETFDPVTLAARNLSFNRTILREGYVQWGGLTAGITYSYFNLPFFLTYSNPLTADQRTNMLAYTVSQGGFSATLALEDPTIARRGFIGPYGVNSPAGSNYAGFKYPDVIGTVKFTSPTFTVQASAAAHHVIRSPFVLATGNVIVNGVNRAPANVNVGGADDWGYAAQVGGEWRFTPRGSVYAGLAYTNGASQFSGVGADDDRLGGGTGFATTDGFSRITSGKFLPTKILSSHIGAGYGVTDTIRLAGSIGYAKVEDDFRTLLFGVGPRADYDLYKTLALVEWSPTQNFRIGAELGYAMIDFTRGSSSYVVKNPATGDKFNLRDTDRLSFLLRVDRRF
ncbi:porin [Prosthecomicrobium sp. N25]|uniref:porin n=1 Tax=Prosthecomicrobium sp. N25 TaxID=3129254 RepID=UPI003077F3DE